MAEAAILEKPPTTIAERPHPSPPVEKPEPKGPVEKNIAGRLVQDGNPDLVLHDIAKPASETRYLTVDQNEQLFESQLRKIVAIKEALEKRVTTFFLSRYKFFLTLGIT